MASIRGFRCGQCRAEMLASNGPTIHTGSYTGRPGWAPPVLCCGQTLRLLDTAQVLAAPMIPRRAARCPRCGYQVRLIVQPASALVCMPCQTEMVVVNGNPDRGGQVMVPVHAGAEVRR